MSKREVFSYNSFINELNVREYTKFIEFVGQKQFQTVETKINIFKEFLRQNKNITEPTVNYIINTGTTITGSLLEDAYNEVMRNDEPKYTLKLISAQRQTVLEAVPVEEGVVVEGGVVESVCNFSYTVIYDNSDTNNDERSGFTIPGFPKSTLFKQENELYLETIQLYNNTIHYGSSHVD